MLYHPLLTSCLVQLFGFRGLASIVGYVVTSQSPGQLAGASISGVVLNSTGSYANVAYYAGTLMLVGSLCMVPGASFFPIFTMPPFFTYADSRPRTLQLACCANHEYLPGIET